MKYKGMLGEQYSGSLGGIVASHNKGGTYFRRRRTPVNTVSILRDAVKSVFASLSAGWTALTDDQRASWIAQASVQAIAGVNGPIHINGNSFYIRNNLLRKYAGFAPVNAFTESTTTDSPQSPTNHAQIVSSIASIAFNTADAWAVDAAAGNPSGLALFATVGFNPSKNFSPSSEQLITVISGTSAAAVSPFVFLWPRVYITGQRINWTLRGFLSDGVITTEVKGSMIPT